MRYNIGKLHRELEAAGLPVLGVNEEGVVWYGRELEEGEAAQAAGILAGHDPFEYRLWADKRYILGNGRDPAAVFVEASGDECVVLVNGQSQMVALAEGRGMFEIICDTPGMEIEVAGMGKLAGQKVFIFVL